jgi:enterochelin esterase-like enzyme
MTRGTGWDILSGEAQIVKKPNSAILGFVLASMAGIAPAAEMKMNAPQLIEMTRQNAAGLKAALIESLGEPAIKNGTAVSGRGEDFIWAVQAAARPTLKVDEGAGPSMTQVAGSDLWYATGKLKMGRTHTFAYTIDGKAFGGSRDVPSYGPDSYLRAGVPSGKLSEKMVHTSKIYDGMRSDYWVYVPAQYNPATPAGLMVFQDGQSYVHRDNNQYRILDAIDNLTQDHRIPVLIYVFIAPGDITQAVNGGIYKEIEESLRTQPPNPNLLARGPITPQSRIRSVEYDTVSDRYAKFLQDEILPEAIGKLNVRRDAYSRAISGLSSGGICSFNVAWQQPEQFSRVLSWIGSFTPLQPEPKWGGQGYPAMVQREAKRNMRVWLQDGAEDQGTWPLQNLEMANSLKTRGYDFHFSYGIGTHNPAQGSAEFPASMAWLWREYDPAKTEQSYEQEASEKAKPVFRVEIYNRDHDSEHF